MSPTLEQRVKEIEEQVARLNNRPNHSWRKAVSRIKPNALTREATRLGAAWRAKENRRK